MIRRVAQERMATVDRLVGGEKRADGLAAQARKALDEQTRLSERQRKDRDAVRTRLKDVEKLLASLSSDQLAELTRLEDTGMAKAQKTFMASGALSSKRTPSRAGDTALAYAVKQIGKPYVWGAEGPAAFDCSGLTSQAWEHAGQDIPRTSQEQWARLPRVPLNELRPGDLVVYFPEATHVAMYLGDGMVVQAPRPGAKVKVSPIAANPLLGAVRPDQGATSMKDYTPPRLPEGATGGDDTGYGAAGRPPADRCAPRRGSAGDGGQVGARPPRLAGGGEGARAGRWDTTADRRRVRLLGPRQARPRCVNMFCFKASWLHARGWRWVQYCGGLRRS